MTGATDRGHCYLMISHTSFRNHPALSIAALSHKTDQWCEEPGSGYGECNADEGCYFLLFS